MPFESHVSHGSPELAAEIDAQRPETPVQTAPGMVAGGSAPATDPRHSAEAEEMDPVAVAPIWLQRLSLFMLVLFCVYLGVLVAIIPWWTRVWDHNLFIESRPELAAVLHLGAVRGFISGLGLLDIWIGISEAIHYRDHRP